MKRHDTWPHSEEAERVVLGALLLESVRIVRVCTRLEPRDWHLERHRVLYQAFLDVADAGSTPDRLTLQAHLQLAGRFDAHGETGTIELDWSGATTSFRDRAAPAPTASVHS